MFGPAADVVQAIYDAGVAAGLKHISTLSRFFRQLPPVRDTDVATQMAPAPRPLKMWAVLMERAALAQPAMVEQHQRRSSSPVSGRSAAFQARLQAADVAAADCMPAAGIPSAATAAATAAAADTNDVLRDSCSTDQGAEQGWGTHSSNSPAAAAPTAEAAAAASPPNLTLHAPSTVSEGSDDEVEVLWEEPVSEGWPAADDPLKPKPHIHPGLAKQQPKGSNQVWLVPNLAKLPADIAELFVRGPETLFEAQSWVDTRLFRLE